MRRQGSLPIEPSAFDKIFHLTESKKLQGAHLLLLKHLYWPSFTRYKDMILLKEQFNNSEADQVDNLPSKIEFWTNFLLLNPYFDDNEMAKEFANDLAPIWRAKLANDFPGHDFIVKVLIDDETGDIGITFFQDQSSGSKAKSDN